MTSGTSISAGTRVELIPGNFDPSDPEDELLVIVAGSNGKVSLVDPNGGGPWTVSSPWLVDAPLASLRDVDSADLDGDGDPDVMLLFPSSIVVLRSGSSPTVEGFSVAAPSAPTGDPRVITSKADSSTHKVIHVADPPTSGGLVTVRSFANDGNGYGTLANTSIPGVLGGLTTVTDIVDGGEEWGFVLTFDGVRNTSPPPRGSMTSTEPYLGAVMVVEESAGVPLSSTAEVAVIIGGASRALVVDLGPGHAGRHVSASGTAVDGVDLTLDGKRDLVVLSDGARGAEIFDVGVESRRIPRRLGAVTLFQSGAAHDRNGVFRPTSQWRLASPLDKDVSDISRLSETGTGPGQFRDRALSSFVVAHLDLGPEPDLLTIDTTNGDLVILRPQPLPCTAFVTAVVHGHQGAAAQLTPLPPPAQQFAVDTSVDVGAAGATEYVRRLNEARRPGLPSSMETPDVCAARHIEVRGHWERQTGGVNSVPSNDIVGAGSLLTAARVLAGMSQYQVGARILVDTDPVVGPHVGAITLKNFYAGSAILSATGLGRDFSGVDPIWYQRSIVGLPFFPEFGPLWSRRVVGLFVSSAMSCFAEKSMRNGQAPVVLDTSVALADALALTKQHVDVCDAPVLIDMTGHSRGAPTISQALNAASSLSVFPSSSRARFNTSIHVNYIDTIDNTHAWSGITWPWRHSGDIMKDGIVRRHGNESISNFNSSSYDSLIIYSVDILEPIVNTRVDLTTNHYVARGGLTSGGKWNTFRPMSHSMSLPQGDLLDLTFQTAFSTFCNDEPATCAPYQSREQSITVPMPHAPMNYSAGASGPGAFEFVDPAQFLDCDASILEDSDSCTPRIDCAPADVHARVHAPAPIPQPVDPTIDCSPTNTCTRPVDFCYASSSHIGSHLGNATDARAAFLHATDSDVVGWAPRGGPTANGLPREIFVRRETDERPFLPDFCGGDFTDSYNPPADDFDRPSGLATVSEELVEDWDFTAVANLVLAADGADDLMRDEYFLDFPEIGQYVDAISSIRWLDGVWVQDACVYAETNPCPSVTAESDIGHDVATFTSELTNAMTEGVDVDALIPLQDEDRLDALFAQIDGLEGGMTEAERMDLSEYYLALVSGQSVTTETYAQFPSNGSATIQSPLRITSRQQQELLLRVDFQFTDPTGYLDVYLTGDSLIESRRIFASSEGLARSSTTFQPSRASEIPPNGLNDIIVLHGMGVNVYSVSVRPHRILVSSTGHLYEFVQLHDGVTWDHARALASRSRYFGLPGRLADPIDAANVLELSAATTPHVPVWVGAKKTPDDTAFLNDDDAPIPANSFETNPPGSHDVSLHAYLSPDDDLLSFRRNSVQIGEQDFGFVVEYDPLPPDPNCLDGEVLRSHWPLSAGDAGGPVIDVRGGTNLTVRTGAAARSVTPLAGTSGNALHFYGSTAFRSTSAPTSLLNDFINGDGSVSIWIKPTSLTGTKVIFSIGGVLADPYIFPFGESANKNVVFQLRRMGDELQVVWENGAGADIVMSTNGLSLTSGATYQVVVSRYNSPTLSNKVDVGLFVSKPGEGRVYEDVFFNKNRPSGTTSANAAVSLGGDWGTNMFTGAIDAVRVWREPLTSVDAWTLFEGEAMNDTCGI